MCFIGFCEPGIKKWKSAIGKFWFQNWRWRHIVQINKEVRNDVNQVIFNDNLDVLEQVLKNKSVNKLKNK